MLVTENFPLISTLDSYKLLMIKKIKIHFVSLQTSQRIGNNN